MHTLFPMCYPVVPVLPVVPYCYWLAACAKVRGKSIIMWDMTNGIKKQRDKIRCGTDC